MSQGRRSRVIVAAMLSLALAAPACRSPQSADVEMEVESVGIDSVSHAPVVLLHERGGKRSLPIWIGALEAQSIAMQIDGVTAPRPLTHDLLKNVLDGVGADVIHVLIDEVQAGTYHARIFVNARGKDVDFDSRPSDAIALALRCKRPILVTPSLLRDSTQADVQRQSGTQDSIKIAGITAQNLTAELAELFSITAGRGVLVADVDSESANGLRRGDVILEVDDKPVYSVGELHALVEILGKGSKARLAVQRGSEVIEVTLPAG